MSDGFKQLYQYAQTLEPKISRKQLFPKTLEITGQRVSVQKGSLNAPDVRGVFVAFNSTNQTYQRRLKQLNNQNNLIILSRDLNYCWERYICTKELMHLFDKEIEMTSTQQSFQGLLDGLFSTAATPANRHEQSEYAAMIMAMSVLCPEKYRVKLLNDLNNKTTELSTIAEDLKLPLQMVPVLFDERYSSVVQTLINN